MGAKVSSGIKLVLQRPARALLLVRMAFWLVVFSVAVKVFSLPRALTLISTAASQPNDARDNDDLITAADALLGLEVSVFKPVCWKRAAILHRFLSERGVSTTINFGVRKGANNKLDGHAWLESSGQPLFESEPPNYNVTYVFPSNASLETELPSFARNS